MAGKRPDWAKPPEHWADSPPVPEPEAAEKPPAPGAKGRPDPTRYGDWERDGIAVDF